MDLSLPSGAYLFGALLFGLIGFAAFRYGKRTGNMAVMLIGVVLMVYPYAVSETWVLYAAGAALCGALYWFRHD
ncbi:hypothetical protein [Massilia sp. TSP1-1-2]|uniref:hypothetical protein n=1 Tax=unclassified Massilia TaxID=2609279 RepID=UPI003CF924DC